LQYFDYQFNLSIASVNRRVSE